MQLTDLRETAALARINMGDEELKKTFPAFEEMLSFLDLMQADTVRGEDPAACAKTVTSGSLRPDTESAPDEEMLETMLSQAPERDGRFIVIPNVL